MILQGESNELAHKLHTEITKNVALEREKEDIKRGYEGRIKTMESEMIQLKEDNYVLTNKLKEYNLKERIREGERVLDKQVTSR